MLSLKKRYKKFSDEQLMQFIKKGNTAAFEELYERYSQRLLLYFYRSLAGDETKAQDFLQDIFMKVVDKPDQFCAKKNFCNWIFTIAHNMCKNEYRRLGVRKIVQHDIDPDNLCFSENSDYQFAEQRTDRKIFEEALMAELQQMDENHRTVFLLRFQQQFSIKEISQILDCAEGTIKSRLFYITKKLALKLVAFNPYNIEVN